MKTFESKALRFFKELPIIRSLLRWSKAYSPAGFRGISVYNIIAFVIQELKKDNVTTRANSVSFSLFLSIFPAIIFLFTLLPLFPVVQDYTQMFSHQLDGVIPANVHKYIFTIIFDITSIKRDGLLSLGAILTLYFSSNGMLTLMTGFDKSYDETFRPRTWWRSRLIAIALTLILFLLLIVSIVITVVESKIIEWFRMELGIPEGLLSVASFFNWLLSILLIYTGVSLIYTFGPSMYRRIRFINIGSMFATIFTLLASLGFSYFINNFGRYNEIYGSIGALMAMMVWIQLNSLILLIGFEINSSLIIQISKNKKHNEKIAADNKSTNLSDHT